MIVLLEILKWMGFGILFLIGFGVILCILFLLREFVFAIHNDDPDESLHFPAICSLTGKPCIDWDTCTECPVYKQYQNEIHEDCR